MAYTARQDFPCLPLEPHLLPLSSHSLSLCPSPFLLLCEPAMPLSALGNMYLLKDVVIVMI